MFNFDIWVFLLSLFTNVSAVPAKTKSYDTSGCDSVRKIATLFLFAASGVKKIFKFSLVPRASTSKFLLVLLPNNLSLSRKNQLALNFLLVRRTLGEKICLSCLKFNLSRAPGQVIFLPLGMNVCSYILHVKITHI